MTQSVDGMIVVGDNNANEIVVELYKDGEKVQLSQSREVNLITGRVMLDDETTMYTIGGSVNANGEAIVVIPGDSRMTNGMTVTISVLLQAEPTGTSNGVGTGWQLSETIASFRCVVKGMTGSTIVVPTLPVTDLNQLSAYIEQLKDAISYVETAEEARVQAENSRAQFYNRFDNMDVDMTVLPYHSDPTVSISEEGADHHKLITFGQAPVSGVSQVHMTQDYKLKVDFDDGTSYTSPDTLRGPQGESAYGMDIISYDNETQELVLDSHHAENESSAITVSEINNIFSEL